VYLASDKLEGRRTGTAGAQAAAEYIAREFSRYGLRRTNGRDLPSMSRLEADSPRRYMQEFPFVSGVTLGRNNSMLFAPRAVRLDEGSNLASTRGASLELRLGEDWIPLGFSSNTTVLNAPANFVGYGIKAAEFNHDDYAGVDVGGRVAIALAGTPDGDNPHGQFARYADVRWKAIAAREHGAAALVIIAREETFRAQALAPLRYDNSAGDAGLPVIVVTPQAAARMVSAEGTAIPLTDLEAALRALNPTATGTPARNNADENRKRTEIPMQAVVLSITTDIVQQKTPGANVIGIIEGSDPQLKNEAIVIGAHYDHLGRGGEGSLATREGEIHHGADDNASGVAGLLELARLFSAQGMRPRRTLIFIAFSGEEEGLLGSNFYVNHPLVPLARTVAMINMDMIGRMKENQLIIGGVGTAAEWREWIEAANTKTVKERGENPRLSAVAADKFALTLNEDGYGPSDHSSFYAKQVPVLFFFTGTHADYHKPSDTADKIDYESAARIVALVETLVRSMDGRDKRPTYTVAKSEGTRRPMGFRVTLGVVPNYAEASDGMKIDGVRDDSPAAKAGLKAGDRVTRLAGREVRNVYDYTYALGEMKAGEEYEIEVVRNNETLKLKITPTVRK
jgi:Zn-dependent M28 family amino/carboxypeptidase